MPHSLTVGMTESGKSTLNKKLSRNYRASGIGVLVLDPFLSPDWQADFITDDPDYFLKVLWDSQCCAVFIDEAGDAVGRYDKAMTQTATRGRHWGHNVHYVTQRGVQISMTVRDQCSNLFLFLSGQKDGATHAEEWALPQLADCYKLQKFEFFHAKRGGFLKRGFVQP